MKQIKIRDKEYNCSNTVYYHIQGLKSENRVISMELLGHENNELQQQKEIERLNNILVEIKEIINNKYWFNWEYENDEVIKEVLEKIEGVDKECK